jgi:transcriptional regulator with XRE-family HTH domain
MTRSAPRPPREGSARKADPQLDAALGARIAARRQGLGLSQAALAARIGVSFQQLQKYESGANRISASRLHHLARALGAPVGDFFPDGGADGPAGVLPPGLAELVGTTEGRRLAACFPRIPGPAARRALVHLAEALAGPSDAARPA